MWGNNLSAVISHEFFTSSIRKQPHLNQKQPPQGWRISVSFIIPYTFNWWEIRARFHGTSISVRSTARQVHLAASTTQGAGAQHTELIRYS